MSGPEGVSERIYRALLGLYPAAFRRRFADEMVHLFGDQLRDARGAERLSITWLRTLGDLLVTAASEHMTKDRTVAQSLAPPPSPWSRVLGLVGVLGGAVLVAVFVVDVAPGLNVARIVLYNLGAIAIVVAIYGRMKTISPRLALAAAAPAILANAWYLVMEILSIGRPQFPEGDPEFRLIADYAGASMWLADAAFGLAIWRAAATSRWVGLALTVGSLFALSGMSRLELVRGDYAWFFVPAALAGIGANGLSWILLGIDVATRRRVVRST
jgi:hypothetical protein